MKKIIITLDGPAGSGKSTTAKILAQSLGYAYLDTGAMYRAIALQVLRNGLTQDQKEEITAQLSRTDIDIRYVEGEQRTFLNGEDVSEEIRNKMITNAVSAISGIREVRKFLREQQQRIGRNGGYVVDGRDIGTAVFPNAEIKFFLTARVEERAKRRQKEYAEKYGIMDLAGVIADIKKRDLADTTRSEDPLRVPENAIELDNSDLTVIEQVEIILKEIEKKLGMQILTSTKVS